MKRGSWKIGPLAAPHRIYLAAFILVLPAIFQVLFTPRITFDDQPHRALEFMLNTIVVTLAWAFVAVSFMRLTRIRLTFLALPIFISMATAAYISMTGESIEYEVFAAISNSNSSEILEFLYSPFAIGVLLVIIPLFVIIYIYVLRHRQQPNIDATRHGIQYVGMFLIGVFALGLEYQVDRMALYKTYPLSIPFFQKQYYTDVYLFKKDYGNISYGFTGNLELSEDANEVNILIIGETARRHSFSVFGYGRETTPRMAAALNDPQLRAVALEATSAGISTLIAVPYLISIANVGGEQKLSTMPSIIHIYNDVGFKTHLISNQEISGRNNDVISFMFRDVTSSHFASGNAARRKFDDQLLAPLLEVMNEGDGRKLIIVHLMGSHWRYQDRYPPDFSVFADGDKFTDTYDNSILYTDHVIGEILKAMKLSGIPTSLIYTSDHGENLNDDGDNNYFHAVKQATRFEIGVPVFFAFNESYYASREEKVDRVLQRREEKVSHDNISHTLLGLAGIYDSNYYQPDRDLSSPKYVFIPRKAINRRLKVIDVEPLFEGFP